MAVITSHMVCKACESNKYIARKNGPHMDLRCHRCDRHIKFIGMEELRRIADYVDKPKRNKSKTRVAKATIADQPTVLPEKPARDAVKPSRGPRVYTGDHLHLVKDALS